jgi:hypothetical protein
MTETNNSPFDSKLPPMCNAWIFLNDDYPEGTNYNSPNSMYQDLILKKVYEAMDIINLSFIDIVPTSKDKVPAGDGSSHTLSLDYVPHKVKAADGSELTNQNYAEWITLDAKKANPAIKVLVTLLWGSPEMISRIYPDPANPDQASAEAFAKNVVTYLKHYNLDGFDIDWEWDYISDDTTPEQFKVTFSAVGKALKAAGLLLTFSPATDKNMDAETVSNHFDIISFQLYSSTRWPAQFIKDGVKPDNFAYGAMFEVIKDTTTPFQDADNAYSEM